MHQSSLFPRGRVPPSHRRATGPGRLHHRRREFGGECVFTARPVGTAAPHTTLEDPGETWKRSEEDDVRVPAALADAAGSAGRWVWRTQQLPPSRCLQTRMLPGTTSPRSRQDGKCCPCTILVFKEPRETGVTVLILGTGQGRPRRLGDTPSPCSWSMSGRGLSWVPRRRAVCLQSPGAPPEHCPAGSPADHAGLTAASSCSPGGMSQSRGLAARVNPDIFSP